MRFYILITFLKSKWYKSSWWNFAVAKWKLNKQYVAQQWPTAQLRCQQLPDRLENSCCVTWSLNNGSMPIFKRDETHFTIRKEILQKRRFQIFVKWILNTLNSPYVFKYRQIFTFSIYTVFILKSATHTHTHTIIIII